VDKETTTIKFNSNILSTVAFRFPPIASTFLFAEIAYLIFILSKVLKWPWTYDIISF